MRTRSESSYLNTHTKGVHHESEIRSGVGHDPGPAHGQQRRRWRPRAPQCPPGVFHGACDFVGCDAAGNCTYAISGEGQATHLGKIDLVGSDQFQGLPTRTAANKPSRPPTAINSSRRGWHLAQYVLGTFGITGGSGRFEGVTGSGTSGPGTMALWWRLLRWHADQAVAARTESSDCFTACSVRGHLALHPASPAAVADEGKNLMAAPSERAATTVSVVRFWHEWSGASPCRRGRIEHVRSEQRADFLSIDRMLDALQKIGVWWGT